MEDEKKLLQGMKILLVDDTPANLDVLRKTLSAEGYEIAVAANGEVALKIARRFMPDLILLDIMMPGIDGMETCRRLKEDETTWSIPVIFITAKSDTEDVIRGFSLGAVDFIAKPFRHEEVLARAKTQLKLRKLAKEKEELIAELESYNEKLVELDALKTKFLGIAAHDLMNPLNALAGYSELLLDETSEITPEELREIHGFINQSANHMVSLLKDLLDVSVIENGRLELHLERGSLWELIENRVKFNNTIAKMKQIKLHADCSEIPEIEFDSARVAQILDNLIGNAIKYSPQGSNIFLKLEKAGAMVKVSVKDEGPGILPEEKSKLFKAFEKLSNQPTGGETSTGLGLAITKDFVEAHNGKIMVDSVPGSGATFSFTLPCAI